MKNILIVETTRDNQGSGFNYFADVNDIPDIAMRNAVIDAINGVEKTTVIEPTPDSNYFKEIETLDGTIFTKSFGYYFTSDLPITSPPYNVEHIVEHIF